MSQDDSLCGTENANAREDIRLQRMELYRNHSISVGSTDKFEDYLQTGGTHLYNDKFQEKDHMVKITVADSGYFTIATQTDGNRSQKVNLYDSTKEKF